VTTDGPPERIEFVVQKLLHFSLINEAGQLLRELEVFAQLLKERLILIRNPGILKHFAERLFVNRFGDRLMNLIVGFV